MRKETPFWRTLYLFSGIAFVVYAAGTDTLWWGITSSLIALWLLYGYTTSENR